MTSDAHTAEIKQKVKKQVKKQEKQNVIEEVDDLKTSFVKQYE